MSKTTGFMEAPRESPWWEALHRRDCRRLMNLLEENPCRVVQKGDGGRTVLHAAAERGCLKLLDQVFDLFGDNGRFVDQKEEIKPCLKELCDTQFIDIEDERVGLTAADYAWWSMGPGKALENLVDGRRRDSVTFVSYQSEVFGSSIDQAEAVDKGTVSPQTLLLEVLGHNMSWLSRGNREEFEEDVRYNFVADCEVLRFHHACAHLNSDEYQEYVEAVIGGCVQKGPHVLRYLFQLRNAQGQTPLHVAVNGCVYGCGWIVDLIPGRESGENAECLNVRDARGWTALHLACSTFGSLGWFLKDGRADVNATVAVPRESDEQGFTALHLAVMHNRTFEVKELLADPRTDVNAQFYRCIEVDENLQTLSRWTAVQWAAVAALPEVAKVLIACPKVKDVGKRHKRRNCWTSLHGEIENGPFLYSYARGNSAIHLAATSGDPETLRLFITNKKYDPLVTCHGYTSLHFAVPATQPNLLYGFLFKSQEYMYFKNTYSYISCKRKGAKITHSHKGREACINLLVQAGVDVWQKDLHGNFPEPGRSASSEYHLAWQQKVEKETLEAKKGLNEAGNAISVVAALVATASYVGPLQPPLGYANDLVQSSYLSVRIFMVTNSTSFYLAIASILFAVVPSLPMPEEGIYEEWQRTRHTIGIAISLLLMAVLGILISFAAASNAVVPEEYSWQHGGLTFYPVVVGGLVCLIGVIWFFIRLLRLIFPKSVMVRHMYQSIFKIKGKGQ